MTNKLLIETFMLYNLSLKASPGGLHITQIANFMNAIGVSDFSEEGFDRNLRRYIKDLKDIGALKKEAKRSSYIERSCITDETTEYSVIRYDDYCTNLPNFLQIEDKLKPLYRIAKILNSECGDDVRNDDTYIKFINSYFSNGLEYSFEEETEILNSLNVIREMLEAGHRNRIDPTRYTNLESLFVRLKSSYGYNL